MNAGMGDCSGVLFLHTPTRCFYDADHLILERYCAAPSSWRPDLMCITSQSTHGG
jgi:hypothetical protein